MSHFTVLVHLGPGAGPDALKAALQPFHEYECTGIRDEYVVFVDETADVTKEFDELIEERYKCPKTGELVNNYDDRFSRPIRPDEKKRCEDAGESLMGIGYSRTLKRGTDNRRDEAGNYTVYVQDLENLSMGYTKVESRGLDIYPGGVEQFAREYHGYEKHEGKIGRWTNPNAKWDWWKVGGRWSGELLLLKAGAMFNGEKGEPGLMGAESNPDGKDVARVGDLDLPAMKAHNVAERRKRVEGMISKIMAEQNLLRPDLMARWDAFAAAMIEARAEYDALADGKPAYWEFLENHPNPVIKQERAVKGRYKVTSLSDYCELGLPYTVPSDKLEDYINAVPALSTFAVLTNGQWYERGTMGWWACVSDEVSQEDWEMQFNTLLTDMDPNDTIAVVDCHI